jgi:hypothetical protein
LLVVPVEEELLPVVAELVDIELRPELRVEEQAPNHR